MAHGHDRGFTLVEMMVVVVIVGILATLAVVGYRKIIQTAHVSEATNMVTNIRVAQEAFHSETQQYAQVDTAIPTALTGGWYPADPVYGQVTAWGGACTGAACASAPVAWNALPLHVDGPVLFGYACVAGQAGVAPSPATASVNGSTVTFPSSPTNDWYIVSAVADLDPSSSTTYTQVWGDSFTNQIFVNNEGL